MNDFSIYREHQGFWKQIFRLSIIELEKSYKGTLFGLMWVVVKPAVTLLMFWFIFEFGIRNNAPVEGISKFNFMAVGFVAWFYMQDTILGGVRCLRKNTAFVTKIKFPISTLMTIMSISRLYVHFMLLILLIILLYISGIHFSIYNIQILYYLPLMFIFFLALSWTTAMYGGYSRDFENTVSAFIQGLFWISGILWNTYTIENPIIRFIMLFNPVNYFVNGYRRVFLYEEWFWNVGIENYIFFAELIVIIILGIYNYKKLRKGIADVI